MLPDEVAPQPELVGVNSVVVEEYDPAKPNDYEDHTREKKKEGNGSGERMMAKMGWKEGQGLGKQEQGITTPLMAKKTDRRAGVIMNASKKKVKGVNFNGTPPTRVLLLRQQVQ
ncbi:hypothetical protein NC653_020352 [Populus alba x Populus x berolinensis]|uniref:G-patch domain-containing protein n=1 Tax=Populus alba x Populus x berolinensis TaxID=444605 RepID=A0AAD6MKJ6_9ROSI|nr:hypothetical protein NC653_020352 [Populus alba x Populus x berolinensis]